MDVFDIFIAYVARENVGKLTDADKRRLMEFLSD